jgi:hypothetical protein
MGLKDTSGCIHTQKYINKQQIILIIYDVFYSQYTHQHVSAGIPDICSVQCASRTGTVHHTDDTSPKLWL